MRLMITVGIILVLIVCPIGFVQAQDELLDPPSERVKSLIKRGLYDEAQALLMHEWSESIKTLGLDNGRLDSITYLLGIIYMMQEKHLAARGEFRSLIKTFEYDGLSRHPKSVEVYIRLAESNRRLGKHHEAEMNYLHVIRILEGSRGPEAPELAAPLSALADFYLFHERYDEAGFQLRRALKIAEKHEPLYVEQLAEGLTRLAKHHQERGRYGQAEHLYGEAMQLRKEHFETEHSLLER